MNDITRPMTYGASRARPPRLATATALVALAAVLVLLLAGCGGGGGAAPAQPPGPVGDGRLSVAASGDLASWARERLGNPMAVSAPPMALPGFADVPRSRTRVQEPGIDEPDLLKSDGRLIATQVGDVRVWPAQGFAIQLHARADDGALAEGARWRLPDAELGGGQAWPKGLLLADDGRSLLALSQWQEPLNPVPVPQALCEGCARAQLTPLPPPLQFRPSLSVRRLDAPDVATLQPGAVLRVDGTLVDARRVGDTLVVVARHEPRLDLPADEPARAAALRNLTDDALLPRRRTADGGSAPLLQARDCWLQDGNRVDGLALTVVMLLDLRDPTLEPRSRCFVGGTEAVYLTAGHLWLTTTRWAGSGERTTDVHQFAVDAAARTMAYRGSATVPGDLGWVAEHRSYRLSEHEGHLRVLSFTGSTWGAPGSGTASPARLTVLKLRSAADGPGPLATVATLPNERRPAPIGKPGEQLFGVVFDGARGYAVTYRQIDPLYVLDIGNPADPRIAGELELPGFSQVLQPLPGGLLLGVGLDEAEGVGVVLFDVADMASPRVAARHTMGGLGAGHGLQGSRHALALQIAGSRGRLALPLRTSWQATPPLQRGLQTLDLDLAARTLTPRTLLGAGTETAEEWSQSLNDDRAALIGDDVYHLRAGRLSRQAW